ncbi:unnamed protein product [Ectocarpus sp. CCAP 1310/34]|nr:unnamed protein product [Ectocarpus sp. CCAP 1310/34]
MSTLRACEVKEINAAYVVNELSSTGSVYEFNTVE